jgi:hypothetical protein
MMAKAPRPSPGEIVRFAKNLEFLCKKHNVADCWFEAGRVRYELNEVGKLDKTDYRTGSFRFKFGAATSLEFNWTLQCVKINALPPDIESLLIAKMLQCTFNDVHPNPWSIPQL